MLGNKDKKKKCCNNKDNITYRTKSPTYGEVFCKKCGYVLSTNEIEFK